MLLHQFMEVNWSQLNLCLLMMAFQAKNASTTMAADSIRVIPHWQVMARKYMPFGLTTAMMSLGPILLS